MSEFDIFVSSPIDDIMRATDVMIVGKRASVCLSVFLVVVCCLPNVTPSAPCRHAMKVSRSRLSCLRSRHLCLPNVYHHFGPHEQVEAQYVRWKHWTLLTMRSTWLAQRAFEGTEVHHIKPQKIVLVSPVGHSVIIMRRLNSTFPRFQKKSAESGRQCGDHPLGGNFHDEHSSNGSCQVVPHSSSWTLAACETHDLRSRTS